MQFLNVWLMLGQLAGLWQRTGVGDIYLIVWIKMVSTRYISLATASCIVVRSCNPDDSTGHAIRRFVIDELRPLTNLVVVEIVDDLGRGTYYRSNIVDSMDYDMLRTQILQQFVIVADGGVLGIVERI
jgi:hypothetical protein